MVNKTISLSWELDKKLKEEENASQLISNLLNNYYNSLTEPVMDVFAKRKEIEELNQRIVEGEKEIEKIEEVKKIQEKTEAERLEFKKRNDEASAKLRAEIEEDLKKYTEDGFEIV